MVMAISLVTKLFYKQSMSVRPSSPSFCGQSRKYTKFYCKPIKSKLLFPFYLKFCAIYGHICLWLKSLLCILSLLNQCKEFYLRNYSLTRFSQCYIRLKMSGWQINLMAIEVRYLISLSGKIFVSSSPVNQLSSTFFWKASYKSQDGFRLFQS